MGSDPTTTRLQAAALAVVKPLLEPLVDPLGDPVLGREAPFGQIDGAAIAAVTDLYREMLPPGGAILDVMSGWLPHLPPEAPYRRVVGIGTDQIGRASCR